MTIVIIEDKQDDYLLLVDLIREAFPGSTILPDQGEHSVFSDWSEVPAFVSKIQDDDVLVCMDLALQEADYHDVLRGVEKGSRLRIMKPAWTIVAYTRWGSRAKLVPDYRATFNGMIDKAEIDPLRREQRIEYVRRTIARAIGQRSQRLFPKGGVRVVDSLGMRLFFAAFGEDELTEIIANEASGWEDITVRALSSGYSGAFMLLLSSGEGTRKSVIVKLAKADATIQDEIEAPNRYLKELGHLNGILGSLNPEKVHLRESGVYYRQAHVDGTSLLDAVLTSADPAALVRPVAELCTQVRGADLAACGLSAAGDHFRLTALDISRFETSAAFLQTLWEAMREEGMMDGVVEGPDEVVSALLTHIVNWADWEMLRTTVRTAVQHGDMNPRNVMLRKDGRVVLIDLARLRPWPVGYDLSRLSLMLRLRTVDYSSRREYLPGAVQLWLADRVAEVGVNRRDGQLCPAASCCDQVYQLFLTESDPAEAPSLTLSYQLGTVWDLVKIVSYQDLSVFKRVWAVIELYRLLRRIDDGGGVR
ncbi:MAG: aminoglycoside phosphotransferase family protein [Acidobacteria bacterium]|nr:aminoglycoside phosphotransferase family protein [Acidobacteriota bacterium]